MGADARYMFVARRTGTLVVRTRFRHCLLFRRHDLNFVSPDRHVRSGEKLDRFDPVDIGRRAERVQVGVRLKPDFELGDLLG